MEYRNLSKKAKSLLRLTAVLQAVCFDGFLAAVLFLTIRFFPFYLPFDRYTAAAVIGAVAAALSILWIAVVPGVRFKRYRYCIAGDRIEIIEGLFFIRRSIVPIDRIHQIDLLSGPLDVRFGLAKVNVITAGSTAQFRFLEEEQAAAIAETLNARIARRLQGGSAQGV